MQKDRGDYLIVSKNVIVEASRGLIKLVSYKEEELIGRNINELFKELRAYGLEMLKQSYTVLETFLFTKELEVRFVKVKYIDLIDKDKRVYFIEEIPNSRIEEKLPYFYKLLCDNRSGVAIYSVSEFVLLCANQYYLDYLDSPFNKKENTIGVKRSEIFKYWSDSPLEAIFNKVVETGETHTETEFMNLNFFERGITYWQFSITPLSEKGQVKYVIFNINDVTETVKSKQILRQQKEEIKAIMDNISDAIFVLDGKGNYIHSNKVAKEYLNHINISKIGDMQPYLNVFDSSQNKLSTQELPFVRALRGEAVKDELFVAKKKDQAVYLNVNAIPIYEGNEIEMVIACCTDITEHLKHEEEMRQQQELLLEAEKEKNNILRNSIKMKDEFLSLMSHEFKTPLNVILSAIQVMECICGDELTEKTTKYINMIRQNTYRQLRLVNNLLDITKVNAGYIKVKKRNKDIVFITKLITESVRLYAEQKGLELSFASSLQSLTMAVDVEKYERILLNLLSNAIKFTPSGKRIEVILSIVKDKLCVEVMDEGLGIPKDKQELIFERFGQVDSSLARQAEGTGIGLFLVKLLVTALGGEITLNSVVGKGSTFTITLPIEEIVVEEIEEDERGFISDRLIGSTATEFSDIYF